MLEVVSHVGWSQEPICVFLLGYHHRLSVRALCLSRVLLSQLSNHLPANDLLPALLNQLSDINAFALRVKRLAALTATSEGRSHAVLLRASLFCGGVLAVLPPV